MGSTTTIAPITNYPMYTFLNTISLINMYLSSPPTLQPSTHTLSPPPQGNSYNFSSTTNISSTTQSHCLTCNFQRIFTYFSAITCITTSITTSLNPSHQHNHQFIPTWRNLFQIHLKVMYYNPIMRDYSHSASNLNANRVTKLRVANQRTKKGQPFRISIIGPIQPIPI